MAKYFLFIAAISGAMTIILGAFGAHALKDKLSDGLLAAYQTGVQYQMFHTLALVGLALLIVKIANPSTWLMTAAYFWIAGIVLFSGSLYGLAFSSLGSFNMSWLGPVTPVGGLLLIIAWVCFAVGISKSSF